VTFYVTFYPLLVLFTLIHVTVSLDCLLTADTGMDVCESHFPSHISPLPFGTWSTILHHTGTQTHYPPPSPRVINLSPYITQFPPSGSRPHVPPWHQGWLSKSG